VDEIETRVSALADAGQRADARALIALMSAASGEPPTAGGGDIIGFGSYHYRYDSGREGDAPRIGFAPRKGQIVLYLMDGFPQHEALLARLGKHKTGKSCLYIKRLGDVDAAVLAELIAASLAEVEHRYPPT